MPEPNAFDPTRVEVLVFDLGGVIFDFDFTRAFVHWADAAGVDPAAVASRFVRDDAYEDYERGRLTTAEYFARLRRTLGLELSDGVLEAGWNGIFGALLPGVDDLLRAAATTFPLYALSNTNAAHEAAWTGRFDGVLEHFTAVLTSHELGHRKPDVACYEAAVRRIGVSPGSVLFFDDLAENVSGARRAGMQAEQVTTPDTLARSLRRIRVAAGVNDDDRDRSAVAQARRQALAQLVALERDFTAFVEGAELVNTDDEHDPEGATIAFERAQVIALRDDAARRVAELDRAQARIEAGTYGRCVVCDGPIGSERLGALPGTEVCVHCAATGVADTRPAPSTKGARPPDG